MIGRSYTTMLSQALDIRARWLDKGPRRTSPITDRDLLAIILILQIFETDDLHVDDRDLSQALADVLTDASGPKVRELAEPSSAGGRACLLINLSSAEESDLARWCADPNHLLIAYGLRDGIGRAENPISLRLRPLAMLNPCLWNSGLALTQPSSHPHVAVAVAGELVALLGDQSLDPLALYEENCQLRQQPGRSLDGGDHEGGALGRAGPIDRQLIALRRFVQGQIEQAVFAAQRATARETPTATIDWSKVFLPTLEAVPPARSQAAELEEAEVRARRARTEAEFLRGQLRAYAIPREVDHFQLIAMSGFFDVAWYAETYDIAPQNAVRHYIDQGATLDYDPSPIFSTKYYNKAYPDVAKHRFNPLLHYLMDGIYEGRAIDPMPTLSEETLISGFIEAD